MKKNEMILMMIIVRWWQWRR